MDMETTQVIPKRMPAEELLLQAGVDLVTLDIAERLVLPVHHTARDFIFSETARQHFELILAKSNSKGS